MAGCRVHTGGGGAAEIRARRRGGVEGECVRCTPTLRRASLLFVDVLARAPTKL